MPIITDKQFNQFIDDSKWLHKNYNELIKEFNLEYIAIRNRMIVDSGTCFLKMVNHYRHI
jgi:hypothetical protein